MAQLNISPPKFTEADLDDAKQRQRIMSYLYKLDEQIRYVLNNLDAENFTEEYQKTIETASDKMERTFRDGQAKVMSRISQTAGEIRAEVADEVSGLQSQIDQTPEKIELAVKEVQVGGTQLLRNAGFYNQLDYWQKLEYNVNGDWRNLFTEPISPNDYRANEVPNLVLHAQKETGMFGAAQTITGLKKNATYTISGYVASHRCNRACIEIRNTSATHWALQKSFDCSWGGTNLNAYTRFAYVFTLGDYTDYQVTLYSNNFGENGFVWWAQVKLEEGNTATAWSPHPEEFQAGTNVLINKNQFSVTTPEFNVNITSEDGTEKMLNIDKDGIHAQSIDCPNVAQRYDGPYTLYVNPDATQEQMEAGNYFRSLGGVADAINDKQLTHSMTINLSGSVGYNETVTFRGICANTWVTIKGTSSAHAKLVGKLNLYFNSASFRIQYLDIDTISSELIGIEAVGRMQNAEVSGCVITGRGSVTGAYGINARDGAMVNALNCELYDLRRSLRSADGGLLVASNCKGNCSPGTNLANMHLSGTQACSNASTWTEHPSGGEIYKAGVTINQGSKPTQEAEATSVSYSATQSDVWAGGGWNNYSNSDIYQGYTSALGEHRGCFWFDNSTIRSALKNKTIKQVTLRLYQMSGSGRNQPVQVSLEGITVSYGGSQPYGKTEHEYGVIGTTLGVNQTTTFTIPTNVITHLVNGDINGFMLRTGETDVMKGDDNSYHYARFAGYDSGNRPVLTVTYA